MGTPGKGGGSVVLPGAPPVIPESGTGVELDIAEIVELSLC